MASLKEQVDELTKELQAANAKIAELKGDPESMAGKLATAETVLNMAVEDKLAADKKVEELQAAYDNQVAITNKQAEDLEEALMLNDDLQKTLEKAQTQASPYRQPARKTVTVKHEGSEYQLMHDLFFYGGKKVTAAQAAGDPKIIAGLLKMKSKTLKKVDN